MTTKHPTPLDRPARRHWLVLLLTFALAMASFACVPDEDTFKQDNPPPASYNPDGTSSGPDLVITLTGVAHDPEFGTWVLYTVTNNGNEAAGDFDVDLYADLGSSPVIGTSFSADFDTVSGLAAGESVNGGQVIDGFSDDQGDAYVVVDSLQTVDESNEDNNIDTLGWGDVSGSSDEVDFESGQPSTITTSNDQGDNTFNWGFDGTTAADGSATSAKSGPISDNFSSCIAYDPGLTTNRIGFFRKVSSEGSGSDVLQFYLSGTAIFFWSGEVDWDYFTYSFPSGSHDFEWCYEKDGSVLFGLDAAWVDELEVQ